MTTKLIPDFTSKDTLDEKFWWVMCDNKMKMPKPLSSYRRLPESFVYVREYGVFECQIGACHQAILATLLAWSLGEYNFHKLSRRYMREQFNLPRGDVCELADYYLESTVGTCYMSSMNNKVYVGKKSNLNADESEIFYPLEVI